jgi:large subunit ribosomal protein L19
MTNRLLESVEQPHLKKDPPQFDVGDTVDVHTRIIEGDKERVQVFSGTVIMRKGKGINETFTVRRIVNNEGVERIYPVHSPFVAKVVVRRGGRTRRAKLFYLRERVGKAVRLTESKRKDKRDEAQAGQTETAAAPAKSKAKNKEEAPELAASAT